MTNSLKYSDHFNQPELDTISIYKVSLNYLLLYTARKLLPDHLVNSFLFQVLHKPSPHCYSNSYQASLGWHLHGLKFA